MAPHAQKFVAAEGSPLRRLFVFSYGFFREPTRSLVRAAGYDPQIGWPGPDDLIGVWGQTKYARRGAWVAARSGAKLVRFEDAFLRSPLPNDPISPPAGIMVDPIGVHFDPSTPSHLETLIQDMPDLPPDEETRLEAMHAEIAQHDLTKYSAVLPDIPAPTAGYVLIIDQSFGDASVRASGGGKDDFLAMLDFARLAYPGRQILIKSHPETRNGLRGGYFQAADIDGKAAFIDAPIAPRPLFANAHAILTYSSQMGLEAILAGHRPHVFGGPFYAGWGLSEDHRKFPRRGKPRSAMQLFAAAYDRAAVWYDPYRGARTTLEQAIQNLTAQTRAWREDHAGWDARHIRLWKRQHFKGFLGQYGTLRFSKPDAEPQSPALVWGANPATEGAARLEDGFIRSHGLGAELIPPLSLTIDPDGIYFDPSQPSKLENILNAARPLTPLQSKRVAALRRRLIDQKISKYNVGNPVALTPGDAPRLLVPGQVEDDASILTGTDEICTNTALLAAARKDHADAHIIYKPHPDVAAGLRKGQVEHALEWADEIAENAEITTLIDQVDQLATMTSLAGFEGLLRGKPVTCYGAPFYAGWGLTRDHIALPRRTARPSIEQLIHATLIDYPRYHDPVTNLPCPVEVVLDRLANPAELRPKAGYRYLSKLQGVFASQSWLWR